jgi:ABC-type nitrate/sulfonate/bicarbonate transport system ATPase subunit
MKPVIELNDVSRIYRDTEGKAVHALAGVSLSVEKGEFVTLIGPSGCGKTTLLRLIAGLDAPESGEVFALGEPVKTPGHRRGFIFQQPALFPWATVYDNVAAGLKARGIYRQKKALIAEYIDMIGLSGFERAYPHEISGGMAQRVAIIRAIINEPEILLLDEPLGALDAFKRIELQEQLLSIWKKTGATFVMVTHDVDEAISLSNRIAIMTPRPGRIENIVEVHLEGERLRTNEDFVALRKTILEELHLVISRPQAEYNI